ncbi:MAG: hypothetical protein AB1792_08825 [Candidatus Zixiibacteriota bacterium]
MDGKGGSESRAAKVLLMVIGTVIGGFILLVITLSYTQWFRSVVTSRRSVVYGQATTENLLAIAGRSDRRCCPYVTCRDSTLSIGSYFRYGVVIENDGDVTVDSLRLYVLPDLYCQDCTDCFLDLMPVTRAIPDELRASIAITNRPESSTAAEDFIISHIPKHASIQLTFILYCHSVQIAVHPHVELAIDASWSIREKVGLEPRF